MYLERKKNMSTDDLPMHLKSFYSFLNYQPVSFDFILRTELQEK